ncbi:MAG: serine/threonine protein kinase, partial [Planctomycetes bacterium]|nr:serine/threonine protein kinase [Planctomycetota bacterium]
MAYTFKHGDRPVEGFTIQRAVGRGGFGEVYYAVSDGGREVALKYLYDNPQIELRGVSHCINLKSPHLVSIFDVKKTGDGDYVIIMEYCSGPSLRDLLIAEPKGFGPQKAAFFVREIAKGLAYLHDRGIVHRDLKPGNIFYDDGYVKIGDYGLSKFISVSRHSAQTASVGTVHYMAPEIGSGNYSRGVDIYALGVILYEMLLGKVPFEGSSMAEILMKHLTAQPELDQLPAPFGDVIRKALAKDPKDRYETADEMIGELLEVESVQQSLAGFSPQSLEGAIRRGETVTIHSPLPSPNPPPPAAGGVAGQMEAPLPQKLAKRMDRISRKLDQKIAKLGGRRHQPPPAPRGVVPTPAAAGQPLLTQTDRRKRVILACMLALGLAIGLGVLVGSVSEDENLGLAASLLIVAVSGAIFLAQKMIGWFGVQYGPTWAQRSIRVACGAPLLGIPVIPLSESNIATGPESAAVWLGLLVVTTFARWDRRLERASLGEMRLGSAIWTAFGALVATAVAGELLGADSEDVIFFLSAGVAGVASLAIQAIFWARTAPLVATPPPVAPHTPHRGDLHGEVT